MKAKVLDIINTNHNSGTLFVLHGISMDTLDMPRPNICHIVDNKIGRLMEIVQSKDQVVSYDEFVCLYDFIVAQYKQIIIIDNSLFHNFYPVGAEIDSHISERLLAHYDQEAPVEKEIGDLSEYTNIYSNYVQTESGIACCYNLSPDHLKNEKIKTISIPSNTAELHTVSDIPDNMSYINICDDVDYFQLLMGLRLTNSSYALTWESCNFGKETAKKKIESLNGFFSGRLVQYVAKPQQVATCHNNEIGDLLKKYWGYDGFRNIKMYDLNEVDQGNKKIVPISQEQIISDLITQAENCLNGRHFKDIFVTAPTGSGKSLMFQLPAMYLAEKYQLMTLVITPLIGLMNDQIQSLKSNGYTYARTINSDISPIVKQEILEEVAEGKCHILYLSPESLLSRSDIEQLIGSRRIGMLVVDEAHIVTTWGKQFRPDYWYLGDHVQKLRRAQARKEVSPSPFIIATFTATAIYEGNEDMYHETINSLHMIDPITYLGYVKRNNIAIEVSVVPTKTNKTEYEMDKFDSLIETINIALMRGQKTLIYFPTVALINRFYDYCYSKDLKDYVTRYHGQMDADLKGESFDDFHKGNKPVMLATKAFGMGIDIPDISVVVHFAPTGNVCDYMQEIGRAARDNNIQGHAIYKHMSNDFKHINRLHGLSTIQTYQLIEVMKKVLEIYTNTRSKNQSGAFTKKRNEMLVDAESFTYIFESPTGDDNDMINKVKTAMLLIQKDYENRGFAPFYMRPIPLFAYGFFAVDIKLQKQLNARYHQVCETVYSPANVCKLNLKRIWDASYSNYMSFPKFKFLLYSKSPDLEFNQKFQLDAAMSIEVFFEQQFDEKYDTTIEAIKSFISQSIYQGRYFSTADMINLLSSSLHISRFKAESIIGVLIASMDAYRRDYSGKLTSCLYQSRVSKNGDVSYQFLTAINGFFVWLKKNYNFIVSNTVDNKLYVVNVGKSIRSKEISTILGLIESFGILRFKSLGGSNSQLYIYVNETKTMQMVRDNPGRYQNRLLDMVSERHKESVKMLTFLFQSGFSSEQIWEHLENYFLGILPPSIEQTTN